MRDRCRGVSLGGTLLAVSVLSLLAFTLASLCVTHLRLSSQQDSGVLASNAARSAISAAISKVLETKTFGTDRAAEAEIRIETGEAAAYLTFNEQAAANNDLSYSTNNLEGTEDVPGAEGALVPSATVHLSAVGRCGNSTRRIEAVLRVPPFPWAIASGGRIETKNGVTVGALPAGANPATVKLEDLLPADLVANAADSQSISLGDNCDVLGDVETPGQVVLGTKNVKVRGEIRNGAEPVKLPTIQATDFDPVLKNRTHVPLSQIDVDNGAHEITGWARSTESVLTFDDPLVLTNGQLYVEGNLELNGGAQGSGMLIATGDITIKAGAQIEGSSELAVVSGGRVDLRGTGAASSSIRGLFYAEKGLDAQELTLVGSLLTGNASTGVALDHVNVYHEEPRVITTETTTTPGLPAGSFNVGQCTRDGRVTGGFSPDTEPMMVGVQPAFQLQLTPTAGGYPVQVSFTRGVIDLGLSPRSLHNESEARALLEEVARQIPSSLNDAGLDSQYAFILTARLNQGLAETLQLGSPGGGTGAPAPSIALYGDISRFLPIEDRIRLVSWVER